MDKIDVQGKYCWICDLYLDKKKQKCALSFVYISWKTTDYFNGAINSTV